MSADILWDAALEVIDAPLLEEISGQNVLPFILPFAFAVGKLSELCGFLKRIGAAEKRVHHRVRLYFSQILAPTNLFCNPECIPKCITLGSCGLVPRGSKSSSREHRWGMPRGDSGKPTGATLEVRGNGSSATY